MKKVVLAIGLFMSAMCVHAQTVFNWQQCQIFSTTFSNGTMINSMPYDSLQMEVAANQSIFLNLSLEKKCNIALQFVTPSGAIEKITKASKPEDYSYIFTPKEIGKYTLRIIAEEVKKNAEAKVVWDVFDVLKKKDFEQLSTPQKLISLGRISGINFSPLEPQRTKRTGYVTSYDPSFSALGVQKSIKYCFQDIGSPVCAYYERMSDLITISEAKMLFLQLKENIIKEIKLQENLVSIDGTEHISGNFQGIEGMVTIPFEVSNVLTVTHGNLPQLAGRGYSIIIGYGVDKKIVPEAPSLSETFGSLKKIAKTGKVDKEPELKNSYLFVYIKNTSYIGASEDIIKY